jgi:hypothetical protein
MTFETLSWMDVWPSKELSLQDFAVGMALAVCAEVVDGGIVCVTVATHGSRHAAIDAHVARCDPGDLPHNVFNGRALGLGAQSAEHVSKYLFVYPKLFLNLSKLCAEFNPNSAYIIFNFV